MNPTDALLEIHWIPRHIEMYESPGYLQIDSSPARARGNKKLTVRVGVTKVRDFRIAGGLRLIPNDQCQSLASLAFEKRRNCSYGLNRLCKQNYFLVSCRR